MFHFKPAELKKHCPADWKQETHQSMTHATRGIVWRRQFKDLSINHPELIENIENQKVKFPLPDGVADKYKTLTNFSFRGNEIHSSD